MDFNIDSERDNAGVVYYTMTANDKEIKQARN
jgi:hypothetical protein